MLPFVWKYRHEMMRLNFRQWGLLLASGVMLALHFLLWMGSLRLTSVASSTVILALEPILILAGSVWLFKAKINRMMIIGMGIALLGSIAIGAGDFQLAGTALQGDFLSLLGTIAVAIHMLLGQFLRSGLSAFSYNFWVFSSLPVRWRYIIWPWGIRSGLCRFGVGNFPTARHCADDLRTLSLQLAASVYECHHGIHGRAR